MTNNKQQTEHRFCLTPELKCTMSYCDENGCINRQRHLVGDPIEMTNNKQQWAVDKAKELIDKMTKQYALIAVDEIINVTAGLKGWIDGFQCWEEVKKEIENYDK